jgi:SAM-dependent methyltransferase
MMRQSMEAHVGLVAGKCAIEQLGQCVFGVELTIEAPVLIEPDITFSAFDVDGNLVQQWRLRDHVDAIWLPRGCYAVGGLLAAEAQARVARVEAVLHARRRGHPREEERLACDRGDIVDWETAPISLLGPGIAVQTLHGGPAVSELSWMKRGGSWFHKHFDHATRTIVEYLLGNSPLLQGRVLDVGCGDGITDLGVALHCEPELFIGVDPFAGYQALPQILGEHGLPPDAVPPCLRFMAADGNHLPFPDDSFDVVISWGAVEHIAGGYLQCLREIKRVLRDGGLFFVVPGLFYSNHGHHLGEFTSEPHAHLKLDEQALHELVNAVEPTRMDRAGHNPSAAEYWQWYSELNRITVGSFEQHLRALEFEPWRAAVRSTDLVEYTPELQRYAMLDLATSDLYLSCWNRKRPRPAGFRLIDPETAAGQERGRLTRQ